MKDTKTFDKNWKPSRDQLLDSADRPMTQMLFLECTYSPAALYTLKEVDHEYKGVIYPSIKRFYLEMEDPTEYEFANKYFLSWNHWQRIYANKLLTPHINEWRYELELKIRARAVKQFQDQAEKGGVQAIKWLAEKGWDVHTAGRPSKADIAKETRIQSDIKSQYSDDFGRLMAIK